MIDRQESMKKIDAALSVAPKSADESVAYPIIKELRDHHEDSLEALLEQEKERAEIDINIFLLLRDIADVIYPEMPKQESIFQP